MPRLVPARHRYAYALGLGAVFVLAAGVLYFVVGMARRPSADLHVAATMPGPAAAAQSMDAAVAGLEARLGRGGGSDADWDLLARAYEFLGRTADAQRARAHLSSPQAGAPALTPAALAAGAAGLAAPGPAAPAATADKAGTADQGWLARAEARRAQHDDAGARDAYAHAVQLGAMSAQSWADYADVLAGLAGGSLTGEPGAAIDKALALDPRNLKALWLKASQAHEQHRYAAALTWWRTLQAQLPADSPDAKIIAGNIAEDSSLAGQSQAPAVSAASGAELSGTVALDPRFATRAQANAVLFIYAKAADSPGPPLAVLRTSPASWPVSFRLDDSMAMLPSRRLSQFDKVIVEARLSRSGQAAPQSGDLYATSEVLRLGGERRLALTINREIG
ncbi:MAG: hypothetical protein JOZ67_01250 [Gammaproteobacteria bacterium]|nr:hypothetical protein [Gammaproteobacteria bacterium]MBV9697926.1 hypothetical protein [Gammaproteobacteria bacterium]